MFSLDVVEKQPWQEVGGRGKEREKEGLCWHLSFCYVGSWERKRKDGSGAPYPGVGEGWGEEMMLALLRHRRREGSFLPFMSWPIN